MAANATPRFTTVGSFGTTTVTAANTKSDGAGTIGTDIFLAFTAGANGSLVPSIQWIPTATTAATTTTNTTGRVFVSTKTSGATTSADTFLIAEVNLPAVSADNSTAPVNPIELTLDLDLPTGYTILVTNHVAPAANSAWRANVPASNY